MPLPRAPQKPADILEDYGIPALPEAVRAAAKKLTAAEPSARKARPALAVKLTADMLKPSKPHRAGVSVDFSIEVESDDARAANDRTGASVLEVSTEIDVKTEAKQPAAKTPEKTAQVEAAEQSDAVQTAGQVLPPAEAAKKSAKAVPQASAKKPAERSKEIPTPPAKPAQMRRGRAATPENMPKIFVLDTNVLMHDPLCLFRFAEHDVFLPMTVLEELDNHKKGLTDVARNARSVSRTLDALIEANDGRITEGVPLSLLGNTEAGGRLWFETEPFDEAIPQLATFKGDNSILATVKGVQKAFPKRAAVLVSKDINMRIKATTLGVPAEDYFSDKVLDDTDMIYSGREMLERDFWERVSPTLSSWRDGESTFYRFEVDDPARFIVNECVSMEDDANFMAIVRKVQGKEVTIQLLRDYRTGPGRMKVWGIQARNPEQNMALNLLMDPEIDFVALLGQAGTGKTLLTLAAALAQTLDERRYSEIIVTRATVSVGEDIGFLPGTEEEKMIPWMGAIEDNLEVLHQSDAGGQWGRQATLDILKSRIRVKSMSFMRGRTFLSKFVIIDEAQNLSPKQMKTLITRAGPGSKIVCLGNLAQIDTPYLTEGSSGLTYVVERFQGWAHAAALTLSRGERSRLAEYAAENL